MLDDKVRLADDPLGSKECRPLGADHATHAIIPALLPLLAACVLSSCGSGKDEESELREGLLISKGARPIARGRSISPVLSRTVYVPIYSHIYLNDPREVYPLSATLSVRNTDPEQPLILSSIRYFNTEGVLVREYLEQSLRLDPLATIEVVVRERDLSGGSGANFLVDWSAERPLSNPIIQSVMIGSAGNQGISFLCPGADVVPLPVDVKE